ncbi:MAG: hypothetical protein ABIV25_02160, partial [Paracoccaceae bacterium]
VRFASPDSVWDGKGWLPIKEFTFMAGSQPTPTANLPSDMEGIKPLIEEAAAAIVSGLAEVQRGLERLRVEAAYTLSLVALVVGYFYFR